MLSTSSSSSHPLLNYFSDISDTDVDEYLYYLILFLFLWPTMTLEKGKSLFTSLQT